MVLTGKDAEHFNKAISRPSKEYIAESRSQMRRICEQISIDKTDDGFEAEVKGLDLDSLKRI